MISSSPILPDLNEPLSEQELLLFWYVARILLRLSERIAWAELEQAQQLRFNRLLKELSQEIRAARRAIKTTKPRADQAEPLG